MDESQLFIIGAGVLTMILFFIAYARKTKESEKPAQSASKDAIPLTEPELNAPNASTEANSRGFIKVIVSAFAIIYFISLMLPSKIEIKIIHEFPRTPIHGEVTIKHDLSGNLYSPITLKLSDPGYPIKVDVKNSHPN